MDKHTLSAHAAYIYAQNLPPPDAEKQMVFPMRIKHPPRAVVCCGKGRFRIAACKVCGPTGAPKLQTAA
jgi:hypothetical protein